VRAKSVKHFLRLRKRFIRAELSLIETSRTDEMNFKGRKEGLFRKKRLLTRK
jgi:hypothetical protein